MKNNNIISLVLVVTFWWTLLMAIEASMNTVGVVGFIVPSNCKNNCAASFKSPSIQTTNFRLNKKNSFLLKSTSTGTTNIENDEKAIDTKISTSSSSTSSSVQSAVSLLTKELKILPILSIFSGISPSTRIIAESHISRLPDCPIAHEIDTMLLWPAVATSSSISSDGGANVNVNVVPPRTIFQYPFAAVTDESLYNVNWGDVWKVFFENVGISLMYSFLISFALIKFVEKIDNEDNDDENIGNEQ